MAILQLTVMVAAQLLASPQTALATGDEAARPAAAPSARGPRMDPVAHLPQNPRSGEIHGRADMLGLRSRGLEHSNRAKSHGHAKSTEAASGVAVTHLFSGQVVDARGDGFQVKLFLRSDPDGVYAGGDTNADGTFSFPVEPGEYTVLIQTTDATYDYGAWGPAGFAFLTGAVDHLVIDTTDVTAEIVIPDASLLSGRVTGNGAALAGIEVDVFLDNALAGVAFTEADGTWAMLVRPGAYSIGFYTGGSTFGDGWLGNAGYVPNSAAAKVVAVKTSDLSVGTIALPPNKTVSGKVTDVYNYVQAGVQVEAWVNNEFYALVTTSSSGAFSVKVPSGSLKLWLFDPDGHFSPGWRTSTGLTLNPASAAVTTVGSANVSGITIKMPDARYIRGDIFTVPCVGCEGGGTHAWIQAEAYGFAASFAVADDYGGFYLPVLPGTYRLWTDGRTDQYTINSFAGGYYRAGNVITGDYALATNVVVTNTTFPDLRVQTTNPEMLTGIVMDGHGWTIGNIQAQAFVNGHFYSAFNTDWTGVFHLPVMAGTFRLGFVDLEGGYLAGWLGPSGWVADYASAMDVVMTDYDPSNISIDLPIDVPPPAPTGVTATPYHQSAGVSWNAVAETANRPIIHYTAIATPGGQRCVATGATTCIVPGLTNGVSYTFKVTAASTVGTSGLSGASGSVQPKPVPEAPGAVAAVGTGSTLAVTWTAPADNGSAITGYTATASPGGKTCTTSGSTGCSMTAVPDGLYTVKVVATNSNGAGPPGAAAAERIDTVAPTVGVPSAILQTGAASGSTVPVKLTWSGSDSGSGINHYEVWQQTNGGAWSLIGSPSTATFTRNVAPSTTNTQRFRVRAFDGKGNASAFAYMPTVRIKRTQQNAAGVSYAGTWTTVSTASASGGSYRHTSTAGRSVSYTFTGRSIAVISHKASILGQFKVYIDGVYKTTVSQYSTTTQWQRVLYALNVSSGTHTIKLVCVGTGGHPRISIDAFVVIQ